MSDNEIKAEAEAAPMKEEEKTASKIPEDAALRALLRSVLADSNLQELTKRAARRKLEAELGVEEGTLDERKESINGWVDEYIQEQDDEEEEAEAEAEEEEPTKKKSSGKGWAAAYLKQPLIDFTGGATEMKRSDVVKMIWEHVKANDLQVPTDKRFINVDERLNLIFPGKKKIHMFSMNKELSKHFAENVGSSGPASKKKSKKEYSDEEEDDESEEESTKKAAKRKSGGDAKKSTSKKAKSGGGGGGGFSAHVTLSPELANVLGSNSMPRCEVVKGVWAYIKENNLQNPANKSEIVPDSKLKAVFGPAKFKGFGMMKGLTPHLTKQ